MIPLIGQPEVFSFPDVGGVASKMTEVAAGGLANYPPTRVLYFVGSRVRLYSAARPALRLGNVVIDQGSSDETDWIIPPPT